MAKDRVLFVCTDGARSRMAAAILRQHAARRFDAAIAAPQPIAVGEGLRNVLEANELPVDDRFPPTLAEVRGPDFRYVVVLDESITRPPHGQTILKWPFPHPMISDSGESFASVFAQIEGTIFDWLTQFEERDEEGDPEGPPAHHLSATPIAPRASQGPPPRPA